MKKYNVTVNGTAYEITLEAVEVSDIKAPAASSAPAAPAAPASPAAAGGEAVKSPMPGTILAVNVSNGASVKKGDVIMVLEAMKMENEIMAPCDGTVSSLNITKGTTVESGTLLCTIA